MGNKLPMLIEVDAGQFGPHMAVLTEKQRGFVYALVELGGNATEACLAAGYGADSETKEQRLNAARTRGYQLAHDPRVLAAIKEEAEKRLHSGMLIAASALIEMAQDPACKDRYKAAASLLDRGGLNVVHKQEVVVTHTQSDREVIARITEICGRLGLDADKIIGLSEPVDAEFTVLPAPTGLEDML